MKLRLTQAGLPALLTGRQLVPAVRLRLRADRLFVPLVQAARALICGGLLGVRGSPLGRDRRRFSCRDGDGPGLGGDVRLLLGLLRHTVWPRRRDGRERLRRGFRLPDIRPHGHPRHGCARGGGRPAPVARVVATIVPVRLLLRGGPLSGHQWRLGWHGYHGSGPAKDLRATGDLRPGSDLRRGSCRCYRT